MELLRLATAGSVDDGKSTLIGRLLLDTQSVADDQLKAIERASARRGDEALNLALLTDGLKAEREQGITIDVAYRFFSTARRKFILADTPGHLPYTRNMVTGASTANVALILVDAQRGVREQSRRHAFIASVLRVPHLVLCINKMDLVGYDQAVFERLRAEFSAFAAKLDIADLTFVPLSALHGENVARRSTKMPWYEGGSLLHHLETVHIASDRNLIDARFPVQWVPSARPGFRGFAGQMVSGTLRAGDEVVVLPSGASTRIASIESMSGRLTEATAPISTTLCFEDALEISRGDMVVRPSNKPMVTQDLDALVCWLDDAPLELGGHFTLKHTTRTVRAQIKDIVHRIDVDSLHRQPAPGRLSMNEIGRVRLHTSAPVMCDEYRRNRGTGSFILVDPSRHTTAGAGMILGSTAP